MTEEFEQKPLPPVEEWNTESSPTTMFSIVEEAASGAGIAEFDQKLFDEILGAAELSDSERETLLKGYTPNVMSAQEKQNLYDAQSKLTNAVMKFTQ